MFPCQTKDWFSIAFIGSLVVGTCYLCVQILRKQINAITKVA